MEFTPDRAKVKELLAFLPGFTSPGRKFVLGDESTQSGDSSVFQIPHPVYPDDVIAFFMRIGMDPWFDPNYRMSQAELFAAEPDRIANASFAEVRALLNHCSRGERFCDGFWIKVLEDGVVQAALRRLETLADQDL